MTITDLPTPTPTTPRSIDAWEPASDLFGLVAVDLYRDVHKGIRSELFAVVGRAGAVDPGDRDAVRALADHVGSTCSLLESHAHHEDGAIQPVLERELPDLAERIERDHLELDRTITRLADHAASIDVGGPTVRRDTHLLYLDVARFTNEYLLHMDIEERVLMPALEAAIGVDACGALLGQIIGSIAPDELMRSLGLMLPAMNVEDRCELLGGIQAGAPPEAFAAIVDLARSVLSVDGFRSLSDRLALG